ncbi:MAG: hypothetical protein WA888_18775 [Burkholderiaceae bacterium]
MDKKNNAVVEFSIVQAGRVMRCIAGKTGDRRFLGVIVCGMLAGITVRQSKLGCG